MSERSLLGFYVFITSCKDVGGVYVIRLELASHDLLPPLQRRNLGVHLARVWLMQVLGSIHATSIASGYLWFGESYNEIQNLERIRIVIAWAVTDSACFVRGFVQVSAGCSGGIHTC